MLSMQNSPLFAHPDLTGSGFQDEGCSGGPTLPTLPTGISGISGLRTSISSSSTGASPDDTSTDSRDWHGGSDRSPPADLDMPMNALNNHSPDYMESQMTDMDNLPKVEELDDEDIQSIKPSDVGNHENETGTPAAVPRKRGRPRKHPLPAPGNQAKVTKGRSKTGCITCRRRKKKCDETKPA